MTKYLKQIQSRLSRRGVKVSQTEIRELYQKVVTDLENPTEEELTAVVASFLSSLTTTNHETESGSIRSATNNCTPSTTPAASGTVEKEDYLALLDESQKTSTISQSQKGEIVQKAFSQLGFTATESEVFEIVKAFETTQTAEDEFFDLVLPLVKDWIKKKTEERVHKYESAYQEIAGDVCDSLQEIVDAKDKFETNLFTFRQTLGEVSENFREDSQKSIRNLQEFFTGR